jgi:DNA-binding XRE family transcriptional regulator
MLDRSLAERHNYIIAISMSETMIGEFSGSKSKASGLFLCRKLSMSGCVVGRAKRWQWRMKKCPRCPSPTDKHGRFPAFQYARISLARDLIRDRRGAGLSQQQLADLAGIRQETLLRIETGKHTASPRTVDKIMRVIEAERRRSAPIVATD